MSDFLTVFSSSDTYGDNEYIINEEKTELKRYRDTLEMDEHSFVHENANIYLISLYIEYYYFRILHSFLEDLIIEETVNW